MVSAGHNRAIPALAWLLGLGWAWACGPTSWSQCEQVMAIGISTGRTECQYKRDYYSCLLTRGCYNLTDGCRNSTGAAVSCQALCESEPGLATCIDPHTRTDPAQDFHLCPHISKSAYVTPAPEEADFLAAPSLPFTFTAWLDFQTIPGQSIPPSSVLPTLWPPALRTVLASALRLNEFAIQVDEPLTLREAPLQLPGSPAAPTWALHTYFIVVNIHVINVSMLVATHDAVTAALVGSGAANLTQVESGLADAMTAGMPANASITLQALQLYVVSGRVRDLPEIPTTTVLIPVTTTIPPPLVRRKWRAWRARCLDGVVHRWEVRELSLWADRCPYHGGHVQLLPDTASASQNGTRAGAIISSGEIIGYGADRAFDGRLEYSTDAWMSRCIGCAPGEAWLGLDAGTGTPFSTICAIVTEGDSATSQCSHILVEASDNMSTWYPRGEIRGFGAEKRICLPLRQEDYPDLNCGTMNDGCGTSFSFGVCAGADQECRANRCYCPGRKQTSDASFAGWQCGQADDGCGGVLDFGTCGGGSSVVCDNHRCRDRGAAAAQWRLVCASGTAGRWWLRDVVFHSEGLCFVPERSYDTALSSGSYDGAHSVAKAFDADTATYWGSRCNRCSPGEAWVGLDFGRRVAISCVELLQDSRTLQQCRSLRLESSDNGREWLEVGRYGFGVDVIRESAMLTLDYDARKQAEDLHRSQAFAPLWRLACASRLERQWAVVDIEFYDDTACSNRLRAAVAGVLHSRTAAWPPSNAFDANPDTLWKSACGRCPSGGACSPCSPGQAYIGVRFEQPMIVRCVKLSQGTADAGDCPNIMLQYSGAGEVPNWRPRQAFSNVGSFALLVTNDAGVEVSGADGLQSCRCSALLAVAAIAVFAVSRWHPAVRC